MIITITRRDAALWFEDELPVRMVWDDRRWLVLDVPTRMGAHGDVIYSPFIAHPPNPRVTGWRFIARAEDGADVFVFDIKDAGPGRFEVLHVYE